MNTAERKIFAAHKQAGFHCGQGMDPTEALIKSANEENLNPEMTRRVSEMLNISLTKAFMKSASDKTETFPIADAEVAIKKVFGEEPRQKSAAIERNPEDPFACFMGDYSLVRSPIADEDLHPFFKSAQSRTIAPNLGDLVCQAEGGRAVLRDGVSKLAQDSLSAQDRTLKLYSGLITHFRSSGNLSGYADFENQCYSEYGSKVAFYLDSIFEQLPETTERGDVEMAKRAFYFKHGEANGLFDSLMSEVQAMGVITSDMEKLAAESADYNKRIDNHYRSAAGQGSGKSASDMIDFKKKANVLTQNPLTSALDAVTDYDTKSFGKGLDYEDQAMYKRPKDEADMEMDNLKRQAILLDLMANDEVIAGQNPKHVQAAYDTLLQLSPKSTLHREVTRSVLRNATAQQAIDPFTAKQLTDLEGAHLKNKMLVDGKLSPTAP